MRCRVGPTAGAGALVAAEYLDANRLLCTLPAAVAPINLAISVSLNEGMPGVRERQSNAHATLRDNATARHSGASAR